MNAWWSAIELLPQIIARLQRVQFSSQPAVDAIRKFDHVEGLIYCDPPYLHATRAKGSRDIYGVEMTDDDHQELATVLHECKAKVVLSGYVSPLYQELYRDWRIVDFEMANHAAGGSFKRKMIERIWMNY